MERYINRCVGPPFTDFGFKKLFGEEANKDLLIDFLNQLLGAETGLITDLTYLRNEHLGSAQEDRRAIFDLYCQNQKGERFIVELQKARQKYFKDRSLYYSTFAIQEQAQTGEWDFRLQRVCTVAIMDFEFDEPRTEPAKFIPTLAFSMPKPTSGLRTRFVTSIWRCPSSTSRSMNYRRSLRSGFTC